jgi:hypothetical protein
MSKGYIPRSDRAFLAFVTQLLKALAKLLATLKVPPEVVAPVSALYNDFEAKFAVSEDENTRTKVTVAAKNEARRALEAAVRQLVAEYLAKNHLMTNEYRTELGLPIPDKHPTRSHVAKEAPEIDVDTSVSEQVTYFIYQKGAKNRQGKPADQTGSELVWAILEAPPQDREELTHSEYTTTHTLLVRHRLKDRGKKVYASARWENSRGQKGPWSKIMSVVIP